MRPLPDPPFQAAILLPRWLGDAVMGSALIEPIAELSGQAVEVWGPPAFRPLFAGGGTIAGYRIYDGKKAHKGWTGLRRFRSGFGDSTPRAVWVLPDSFSSAMAARFSPAEIRVGRSSEGRGMLLSHALKGLDRSRSRHWTEEKADLIRPYAETTRLKPGLRLDGDFEDFEQWVKNEGLTTNNYAIYAPGAMFGPAKHWRGFAPLAEALPESLEIVLVGSASEAGPLNALATDIQSRGRRVRSYPGSLGLAQLGRLCRKARFVLSNDSGVMHLAAAVGARVLGLFLSTDPTWTAPLGDSARHLAASVDCRPCFQRECPLPAMICQDSLDLASVMASLDDWMEAP